MDPINHANILSEEEKIKERLESLRRQLIYLHEELPCLTQCSYLGNLLQKLYEIREEINQFEQGLIQNHLKCCISPMIKVPEEVVLAISKLSSKHHGAIIVIEQENTIDEHLKGGIIIEAVVNAPMLENIFYPGGPLHDGAVIIRNKHIIKACALLPLAPQDSGLKALRLGARHSAALGLSLVSDALVIVVSEEKGWISFALRGQLYPNLGTLGLLQKLETASDKEIRYRT